MTTKTSFFVLLSALVLAISAEDVGYDREGSDLPGMPINLGPAGDSRTCAALCRERGTCRSWAFDICNSAHSCWLKHSIPTKAPSPCRVRNLCLSCQRVFCFVVVVVCFGGVVNLISTRTPP